MKNEFQTDYIPNDECLACASLDLRTILDLGRQPLANSYHNGDMYQPLYPLKLNVCSECFHLQLSHVVNPDLLFKNYLYVSGTSQTLRDYFDLFAKITLKYAPLASSILDIASNDGSQLDSYKKLGLDTYGIDPAQNLYEGAVKKGHNILCDYFNSVSVEKIKGQTFDIITAQNVFAHTKYTKEFLWAVSDVMHEDSCLFIQTSQANMVVNNEFDTIYHEHVSFFNTNSMKTLLESCGLHLADVFKTDVHGTSYVFVITKKDKGWVNDVQTFLDSEKDKGLYDILTYPKYALKCYETAYNLKEELEAYSENGYLLVGYGAAAKGNTLLNFGKIKLDVIIDDNPLKQDLLTPGRDIIIKGPEWLETISPLQKVIFIPLAWNFYKEIKTRIKARRNNPEDLFLKYFPTLEVSHEN